MNELSKVLEFNGMELMVVEGNGKPIFAAKDLCKILDIKNSRQVIQNLDEDEKLKYKIYTSGQTREVNFVNEAGLYSLIFSSNKPEAKNFKRWVTHEVLPSIRRQGFYINSEHPNVLETLKLALGEEKAKELEKINAESLQVKYGFAFHDPEYICQYEVEKEIKYATKKDFYHDLYKMGYIDLVQKPYRKFKVLKKINPWHYELTEKAIEENSVQCAMNYHVKNWRQIEFDGYCFRVKRELIMI